MGVRASCAGLAGLLLWAAHALAGELPVGLPAPAWEAQDWVRSQPLSLEGLRGKVVLLRWWTGPGCRFCAPSLPRLEELHQSYGGRGLVVIGFYHEKADEPLSGAAVGRLARRLGAGFPVARDPDWGTLKRYWLDSGPRPWTSVSFLIDGGGTIRDVHPGGEITREDAARLGRQTAWLLERRAGAGTARDWLDWAVFLLEEGRKEAALGALRRSLTLDPNSPLAWSNHGTTLLNLGRAEDALQSYSRAIELAPQDPYPRCSRASAFLELSRPEEALRSAEAALAADPSFAPALANMGLALERLGREEEARASLERAFRLDPSLKPRFGR